jgi:hypothetical protein
MIHGIGERMGYHIPSYGHFHVGRILYDYSPIATFMLDAFCTISLFANPKQIKSSSFVGQ